MRNLRVVADSREVRVTNTMLGANVVCDGDKVAVFVQDGDHYWAGSWEDLLAVLDRDTERIQEFATHDLE